MAREQFAAFNVVGTYPDMESARKALAALEQAGIDGLDISLLGRPAQEAASDPNTQDRDAGVSKDVSKAGVLGTVAGGGAGAVAGLVGGALAFGIPGVGPVIGSALWASVLGGAGVGAAIGGLTAGTAAISQNPDWETAYNESVRQGRVLVGVHVDDGRDLGRVEQVLHDSGAMKVDQFDAERHPIPRS